MKIAVLTPILYDETSPFNHLFHDVLDGFLKSGSIVERYVAVEDEKNTDYTLGVSGDIRYFPFIRKKAKKSNIISRYLLDTITTIRMASRLKKSDADILFEDVSYSSLWSVKVAKKKGMRVVAMLQDIWPDNAVAGGIIGEKSLVYKFFEFCQKPVYRYADKIICISEDMRKHIIEKGVPEDKVSVIYNWGYSDEVVNIPAEENEFLKKYNLKTDTFYAVYAGNIGKMENVEIVVEAAKYLSDEKNIKILIVGDGVSRKKIEKLCENACNIMMFPMQPSSLATHVYSAAGINIIPLVKDGIETALPSKTAIALSCGKEIAFCFGECEFNKLLKDFSLDLSVPTDNPVLLAEIIKSAYRDNRNRQSSYYSFFKSHFTRSQNVDKYVSAVKNQFSQLYEY